MIQNRPEPDTPMSGSWTSRCGAPRYALCAILVLAITARAQANPPAPPAGQDDMAGMKMDSPDNPAAAGVHQQMEGEMMDSPHMRMTPERAMQPGDQGRADSIVAQLKVALRRYADYHVALADGFTIFAPKVPQKVYHFSNFHSAIYSAFTFDAKSPTSLLYKKTASGYELVGAMYTAPRNATMDELNSRVPLSVAHWHVHVNLCVPPKGENKRWLESENGKPLFGPKGSIATKADCDAAGGRFIPQLFGWMVHVNPYEADPRMVWGTHHDD